MPLTVIRGAWWSVGSVADSSKSHVLGEQIFFEQVLLQQGIQNTHTRIQNAFFEFMYLVFMVI